MEEPSLEGPPSEPTPSAPKDGVAQLDGPADVMHSTGLAPRAGGASAAVSASVLGPGAGANSGAMSGARPGARSGPRAGAHASAYTSEILSQICGKDRGLYLVSINEILIPNLH